MSSVAGNKASGGRGADGDEYGGGNGGNAFGGGLDARSGSVSITDSTFSGNKAKGGQGGAGGSSGDYGGFGSSGGAAYGGAIYAAELSEYGGPGLAITNTTLSGNKAKGGNGARAGGSGRGGSLYFSSTTGDIEGLITNSTIAFNVAAGGSGSEYGGGADGGGIFSDYGGGLAVRNSIIARNTGDQPDVSGAVTSQGDNLVGNVSGSSGFGGNDLIGVDARLGPLANNGGFTQTHALLQGSPAINAVAVGAPAEDQRGASRTIGGAADIGAFEFGATAVDLRLTHKAQVLGAGTPQPDDDFIVYTIVVKNAGTAPATGVTLTDSLSTQVTFDSATSTQGSCSHNAGIVTCNVGNLAGAAQATITIKVKPPAMLMWVENQIVVAAAELERSPTNNSSRLWVQAGN
jgi:uncharacterized repeat protein (TIGR01451 family)